MKAIRYISVLCLICSQACAQTNDKPPVVDWVKVTDGAAWQARDSSGELVLNGKLWLLGGWFDSFTAPPRDVWSSADGKHWEKAVEAAPWRYSDLSMTIAFNNRMWIMGGWTNGRLEGHGATNEVWSSPNGQDWKLETEHAGWSPRLAAGLVEFKGRMWMLGGTENYYFGDNQSLRNDVWSSADGVTWRQEIDKAPWSPRAYHQAVVLGDRMWVLGGGNYVPEYAAKNDVWSSTDGVHWEQATAEAAWKPRLWFSALAYRDHMWVLGGWAKIATDNPADNPADNRSDNFGDVWYSADGQQWQQLTTEHCWKARHEHSSYVFQDQIFVAAGHAKPLSNEVWSLRLPENFGKK